MARLDLKGLLVATILLLCWAAASLAAEENVRAKLESLPRPWKEKVHRVTREEYEETLRFWAEKHPGILTVERIGVSTKGMGIFLLAITDKSVADADKQIALIPCLHGGPERSGTSTAMHFVEWLLGESPEAAETRRKQIVLVMPIINPEAYFETDRFGNAHGVDPYTGGGADNWDLAALRYKQLDKSPEIKAFLEVVDRYQPEVIADLHGVGLQEYAADRLGDRRMYQGQTMFEVACTGYSNYSLRPWDWRVTEAVVAAGRDAGYPSDRVEADAQRSFGSPALAPLADRLWLGAPNFYTAQYAYLQYHTMVSAFEIGWEEGGVARLKGLLKIGNNVWDTEDVPGYPVNRVAAFVGHFVTSGGQTATERRQSRIELWQRQGRFRQAMLYPQTDGRDSYLLATSDEAAKLLSSDKAKFLASLEGRPGLDVDAIRAFFDVGPEDKLYVQGAAGSAAPCAIEHGLGMVLRLPYRGPELVDLRLNGQLLAESPTDGYRRWLADGHTHVRVNVPPEKTKTSDLFVVTCAYRPDAKRTSGWTPPPEVLQRVEK